MNLDDFALLDLHDATIESALARDRELMLGLRCCVFYCVGHDVFEVWWCQAMLTLRSAVTAPFEAPLPVRISDGSLVRRNATQVDVLAPRTDDLRGVVLQLETGVEMMLLCESALVSITARDEQERQWLGPLFPPTSG